MCPFAVFAEVGGLMSYGVDVYGAIPQLATYVDKIFRGAKSSELPIQQPTRIDLVINHKTADALQLSIPRSLLVQAAKVIE
jgi:putative ABC transport system substrate-binding protein